MNHFGFLVTKLVLVNLILNVGGTVVSSGKGEWTHQINLEEDGVRILWKNSPTDSNGNNWMDMEISAENSGTGYLGIGFSPNGAMAGGDMVIAWVGMDGNPNLRDFHATHNGLPIEDDVQNVELLSLSTNNGWTTLSFRRKWDTCDPQDVKITNDTMRLIWAHSETKPQLMNGKFMADWHGPTTRGAKSIIIADGGAYPPFPDESPDLYSGVKSWDMTMDKVQVEAINTTYHCKILKFTDTSKKHHLIGWKPILQRENRKIVHHIVIFECTVPQKEVPLFDTHASQHGGQCYTRNMPLEWSTNCVQFMFVWVVGSEGEMFPDHVGIPLGQEHGGGTYFMVEMHYENPGLRRTVDSSGVRLFYTDNLRESEGGVILVGYRHSPFLLIPPRQDNFMIHGLCGSECTERMLPPDGIHITNTLVHMHLAGRKVRLRHFRNGIELPIIAEDNYYDFNYQQSRTLQKELTILPGDELIAECEYETQGVERYVLGGLATNQEMCQIFFVYYPRLNLTQCTSQYEFNSFFKGFGVDGVQGEVLKTLKMPYDPKLLSPEESKLDLPDDARELEGFEEGISYKSMFDLINITSPKKSKGLTVGKRIMDINWYDKTQGEDLEEFWKHGKHYAFCTKPGRLREPLEQHTIDYPIIMKPLPKEDSRVCRSEKLWKYSHSSSGANSWVNPANLGVLLTILIVFNYWI